MYSYSIQILDTQTNCLDYDYNQYAIQVVLIITDDATIIQKSKKQVYENELQSLRTIKRQNAVNWQGVHHEKKQRKDLSSLSP